MRSIDSKPYVGLRCLLTAVGLLWAVPAMASYTVSYTITVPRKVQDSSGLKRTVSRSLGEELRNRGLKVARYGSYSKGFHLRVAITVVRELYGKDAPPSCFIDMKLLLVHMPRKVAVMNTSSHGRAALTGIAEVDRVMRNRLRKSALRYASEGLVNTLKRYLEERGSNPIALNAGRRPRGAKSARKGEGPLRGRKPQLKPVPASFDESSDLRS